MNQKLNSNQSKVWIVEHRQSVDLSEPYHLLLDTVVLHVSSSLIKAREWCRKNTDTDTHDPNKPWWFAIFPEYVDGPDGVIDSTIVFVDWDGKLTNKGIGDLQPIYGYDEDNNVRTELQSRDDVGTVSRDDADCCESECPLCSDVAHEVFGRATPPDGKG